MDTLDAIAFARQLIDIDSTTGREQAAGQWLASRLEGLGYTVDRQAVADGRFNVFARLDRPAVVLSTHFDCVPPFFPSDVRDGALYGRGACDAKGILAAQVASAERLRAQGERRVGLLFVVGEERGSDGAAVANAAAPGSAFLINGEPTDSQLALATRGVLRLRLTAIGRAAHSAAPGEGESAIDKLMDALIRMRSMAWPSDPELGETFHTLGSIEGGIAPNVISPSATAEVMFRIVGPADDVLRVARTLEPAVTDRGSAARADDPLSHRCGSADGSLPVHHRRAVPRSLGHAAAVRPGIVPGRAHRPGTREARRVRAGDRPLRAAARGVPQLPAFFLSWSRSALSILVYRSPAAVNVC